MYVHSRPLSKLCEFDGKPPPKDYKSDCYHDVDETEFACKEKHRIMVKFVIHNISELVVERKTYNENYCK